MAQAEFPAVQRWAVAMTHPIDSTRVARIAAQASADFAGAMIAALAYLGDRLGLFTELARGEALTSVELARRVEVNERYVREWASAMVASEYLDYDPGTSRFRMSPEQAMALVDRSSPFYVGGGFLYAQAAVRKLPELEDAFRDGGGVPFSAFGPEIVEAIERLFEHGYRTAVAPQWIAAIPELSARLKAGADVAEVGCGAGQALVPVARAYPKSRFFGYDIDHTSIERAKEKAAQAGVSNRLEFLVTSAEQLPERSYDLIMAFNCIHDMVNPRRALSGIRQALKDGGIFLWSEARASDRLEENVGQMGRMLYAASTLHCMTVSLAGGGEGLGAVVGPETVRALAEDAGFSSFEILPVDHAYHRIYSLRR